MRKLKLFAAFAALGISGVATAETYTVTGGNWDSVATWSTNATGEADPAVFDGGDTAAVAVVSGSVIPGIGWNVEDTVVPGEPGVQTGTYSGTIITDESGVVTGGSLIITGTVNKQVIVAQNSWWSIGYDNMTIDFDTGTPTADMLCWKTIMAPAPCASAIASEPGSFAPIAGNEGSAGAAKEAATFDGTTLTIFTEGYAGVDGSDYENIFTLTATPGGGGPAVVAPAADVTEAGAAGGDGDFALLELSGTTGPSGELVPQIRVIDGASGTVLNTHEYFATATNAWQPIAIDTVSDGNSDGTADDPAVVMLAQNLVNGQIVVQTRYVSDGTNARGKIYFFDPAWTPIDVAVVNDINGDGTTGDTGIAVLAKADSDGRHVVRMTPYTTANNVPTLNKPFFTPTWDVLSIEASTVAGGGDSALVVLAEDAAGTALVQQRLVSSGVRQVNVFGWGSAVDAEDLTIVADGNRDGTADDPAVVFYGERVSNGNPVVRARLLSDGSVVDEFGFLGSAFAADRITSMPSANYNAFDELAGTAEDGSDVLNVRLRDYSTRWVTSDLQP